MQQCGVSPAWAAAAMVGLTILLATAFTPAAAAETDDQPEMPLLEVPVDPAAYREASRGEPYLQRLSMQNAFGYQGMGSLLLDPGELPVADRPHVDWADPLPGGPIRIAYFVNHNNHGQGNLAAIARRLDCELFTIEVPYYPLHDIHRYTADHELGWLARRSLKLLEKDFDVIVLDNGSQYLPVDVQRRIAEKVRGGTGLYVGTIRDFSPHGGKKAFAEDEPFVELMPFAGEATSHAGAELGDAFAFVRPEIIDDVPTDTVFPNTSYYQTPLKPGYEPVATHGGHTVWVAGPYGDGRVVATETRSAALIPRTGRGRLPFSDRYHDYAAAGSAKLIRWLAGREPDVTLDVEPPHNAPAGEPFELDVALTNTADSPRTLSVTTTFRDYDFFTLAEQTASVTVPANGSTTKTIAMPAVPAGSKFVASVIARDDAGASVDWGSAMVETAAPETLTVETDREIYETDATVHITAEAGELSGAEYDAVVRVFDDTDRVVSVQTLPLEGEKLTTRYAIEPVVTSAHHVEVTLRRDGQAARVGQALFYVPRFGWDDWRSGLWPYWWTQQYQSLGQHAALMQWMGIDTSSATHGREPIIMSKLGLGVLRLNDGTIRPRLLYKDFSDAKAHGEQSLRSAIRWAQRYGVVAWNFHDERHLGRDPGFSDPAVADFRDYLRDRYDNDLAALNRVWGTSLSSFDDAGPWSKQDVATTPSDLGGWIDTRLFIRDRLNRIDAPNASRVRKATIDNAAIGIDAFTDMSHHAYSGIDWGSMLTGHFNTHFPYVSENLANFSMLLGLAPDDTPFPVQGGEKMFPKHHYYATAWQQTLAGGAGGVIGLSRFMGNTFIHQFGHLYRSAKWIEESDRPLREGLGKLLMESTREKDPVVFLYGYESMMANLALGRLVDPENNHTMQRPGRNSMTALQRMVADNGVTADWLTAEQVAQGGLDGRKLLVLPSYTSVALSDQTCAAIERFVENGGTVLADLSPALFTERGEMRDTGGLDHVFGVTRDALAYKTRPTDYLVNGMKRRDPRLAINNWFIGEYFELGLEATDGAALGEHIFLDDPAPALVLHDFGDGHALLLNFLETQYARHPYDGPMNLVRNVLDLAGVEPNVSVSGPKGERRWGYQLTRYRDGDSRYIGLYRMSQTPSFYSDAAVIRLPEAKHLYVVGGVANAAEGAMRKRAYLGQADRAEVSLRGMGSVLLAALPYRVNGLDMQVPRVAEAGDVVEGQLRLSATDDVDTHVVHVNVIRPSGLVHRLYSDNVVLDAGRGAFAIPFAVNDPAGTWTIEAHDATTGVRATRSVELREAR